MAYGFGAYGSAPYGALPFSKDVTRAEGFSPARFGAASAGYLQFAAPAGFAAAAFGLSSVYPGWVPGRLVVGFGSGLGTQVWAASSLGPVAKFSSAYTSFLQTKDATGHRASLFGTPLSVLASPVAVGRLAQAFGWRILTSGPPNAAFARTAQVAGFKSTAHGVARSVFVRSQASFLSAFFGQPRIESSTTSTSGFLAFRTGLHSSNKTYVAVGFQAKVRFGSVFADVPDSQKAFSINLAGRFGQPLAKSGFFFRASGLSVTNFGQPAAKQNHRAFHIPPVSSFGAPTLVREAVC